jgi:multisubunit Na+/H+ antiporter MnhF subunit
MIGSIYRILSGNRLEPVLVGFCIVVIVVLVLIFLISYYFARTYIIHHSTPFFDNQVERGEE